MKNYLRYSCSVCKRTTDKIVDTTHFMPDKCTISYKCSGRLLPIAYKSSGAIISTPEVGITDWRPRGSPIDNASKQQSVSLIDTACGSSGQIVLAVKATSSPPIWSTVKIKLEQQSDTPKNYKQYVFRSESQISTVSGVESGLEKKVLRYGLSDIVEVYLNGVKLSQGLGEDEFQIYTETPNVSGDGTIVAAVPPNTVKLNKNYSSNVTSGLTQVDVIVSASAQISYVDLVFGRNKEDESRKNTGVWENVDSISMYNGTTWQNWYLFTLDLADATQLTLNTILTATQDVKLIGTTQASISLPLSSVNILLARKPYSTLDRYTNAAAPLEMFYNENNYFKYVADSNKLVFYITEPSVKAIYPPARTNKFSVEQTIKTPIAGVSDQIVIDENVIVGPDQ